MSRKLKISLLLISTFIVFCFELKFYLDKTYLNQFERTAIVGEDRYETMVKISQKRWKQSKEAVLVNSNSMLDAISASPFSYKKDIPMFFIEQDNLNTTIKDELKRLDVEKVYLIGGELSIGNTVDKSLNELNIETERIAGERGFDTTLLLAKEILKENNKNKIAIVNADYGIPNGLSFVSIAQRDNIPIIMTKDQHEDELLEFIKENNVEEVYILGSNEQVSESLEKEVKKTIRINGKDRFDTNKQIIQEFYNVDNLEQVYITKGGVHTQAEFLNTLSISPIAARENIPVILSKDTMDKELLRFLEDSNVKKISEIGFEFERPKIINKDNMRYIVNVSIIILSIFVLRRVIYM